MVKIEKIQGLTLIELLVVISIIGLLSAIALLSVAQYRYKAQDARIWTGLSQIRVVASLIYDDDNSYANLCKEGTLNDENEKLKIIEDDVRSLNGNENVICYATGTDFCVQSVLKIGGYYCVDSNGLAVETKTSQCVDSHIKCSP